MKVRILVVAPYPPPHHGTSVPTEVLVEWLRAERGFDVNVVNTQYGDKTNVPLLSPRLMVVFLSLLRDSLRPMQWASSVLIMGSQRFSTSAGIALVILGTLMRKKVAIYVHGGGFDVYWNRRSRFSRWLITRCLRQAHRVIFQTELVTKAMHPFLPAATRIPNWTRGVDVNDRPKPSSGFHFYYVGEIRKEKGIEDLLKAFRELHHERPDISLDLIGPVRLEFEDSFRETLGDTPDVKLHGELNHSKTIEVINKCDALVFPTQFPGEGYPGAVIEAFVRGIPVIATAWRSIPEIVTDGVNGLLIGIDCVQEELLRSMKLIASDHSLYSRLSRGALNSGRDFVISKIGPLILDMLGVDA